MKKSLKFILVFLVINIQAQTITSDWFFQIGDEYTIDYIHNNNDFDIPSTGIDQTWDFSTAIVNISEVAKVVESNTLEFYDFFPESNIAILQGPFDVGSYYKVTEDSLYLVGTAYTNFQGIDLRVEVPTGSILAISPMNFGDSISHDVVDRFYTNGNLNGQSTSKESILFNGIGMVILPDSTYENCIMLTQEYYFDGEDLSARVYSFYQNRFSNKIGEFATYYSDQTGQFEKQIQIQTSYMPNLTSTSNTTPIEFILTQINKNQFKIQSDKAIDLDIQVIDANGRLHQQIEKPLTNGENIIDIKEFKASGMYFIVLCDKDSGRFYTHKFTNIR